MDYSFSSSYKLQATCCKLTACAVSLILIACARPAVPKVADEPIDTSVAVATFDSLYSKVANTYVDTAFTAHKWIAMRDSLRPRALTITKRSQLDALLADALHYIPDSHFYIIPARIAP